MRVDLFDFELPEGRIALRPVLPRESAKLLHLPAGGGSTDRTIGELPSLLRDGDLLVFNDTRVIPAQLEGRRLARGTSEPSIGVTLHQRLDASTWKAFVRGARKLGPGDAVRFGGPGTDEPEAGLDATVTEKGAQGEVTFRFALAGPALDAAIAHFGAMPLPPYIAARRNVDEQDARDYQTVYASKDGAVAAPTAGLHFTPSLLQALDARDIERLFVTLHVGAGTFLPVKAAETSEHRMHSEIGIVDMSAADRINAAKAAGRRVVCVGTTSLRLLESAAQEDGTLRPFAAPTDIFITPGYRFRAVDALLTNFHLPRSTLFMLVAAFSGLEQMKSAYAHAIESGYRFYSYGDACLLERA